MGLYGGRVQLQVKTTEEVTALKIIFKNELSIELQEKIRKTINSNLSPPKEEINDEGNMIIIKKAPFGGFKRFVRYVSSIAEDKKITDVS